MRGNAGLQGYGTVRPAREGYRVGPLFADDAACADELLDALLSEVPPGASFYLDVPLANAAALSLVRGRGMTAMFETARMYRGPAPDVDIAKVFGVTSLELG